MSLTPLIVEIKMVNEHDEALNELKRLVLDHETQLNQQRKSTDALRAEVDQAQNRIVKLENENRQLRNEISMSAFERKSRKARQETGKIIGLGFHYTIPRPDPMWNKDGFATNGPRNPDCKPLKLDAFGTVKHVADGHMETILIDENGKLKKVTKNGLVDIKMDVPVVTVVSNYCEHYAIDSNNRLWSWKKSDNDKSDEPVLVEELRHKEIKQVSKNGRACVTMSGELYVWNFNDKFWPKILTESMSPHLIQRKSRVLQVEYGRDHILILQEDGVYAISDKTSRANTFGELGVGDCKKRNDFTKVEKLNGKDVVKIDCGIQCSAALTSSGHVYVWGKFICGALPGWVPFAVRPLLIKLDDVTDIAVGPRYILAVVKQTKVYAWGENERGTCGQPLNSDIDFVEKPTLVPDLGDRHILEITVGEDHVFIKYQSYIKYSFSFW